MKRRLSFILPTIIALVLGAGAPAHAQGPINPDFSNGLNGWTVSESGGGVSPGSVAVEGYQAVIREGDSFLVTLQQTFNISDIPATLSFDIIQNSGFDHTAAFIPDAFEVSLLDANSRPLVAPWKPGATSFFNLQEDGTVHLGSGTTYETISSVMKVTLDIRSLQPEAEVTLIFDFIGGDPDINGEIRIDSVVTSDLEPILVAVDIKPPSCPNPLSIRGKGVLSVAILGTSDLDVSQVNFATLQLEGVAPISSSFEDLTAPYYPLTGKTDALDCTEEGPDGLMDLRLEFDRQEVAAALGDVSEGEIHVLNLTGNLLPQFGRVPIVGEDVVVIGK